ncbi:MAG: CGGC domain-containing protein [Solidesulfovibrio sp.]|uniref:CGGC domain-containing protein n=1 Tax=Solidesulfovibrio sp. TaxID=2910990 RepID=UPI002B218D97|nr:CGGC domain-containing protein [Solidesulfovibrio sp.]MEA4854900.1 CGGC domain-containing protein [Solidesulfovibrio sp.]
MPGACLRRLRPGRPNRCCSAFGCLKAAYAGEGAFAAYPDGVRVMGVINCAGCAGKRSHDKILRRVGALAASGVSAIHLSFCLLHGCLFVAKYEASINKAFPGLTVVRGSHPELPEEIEGPLLEEIGSWLTAPRKTVPEIGRDLRRSLGQAGS